MPVPSAPTADGQAALAALAAEPARALVASDYDGTLSPIVDDPAAAVAVPGAVAALTRLAARVGTVAIITGRPAADAVSLGGLGDVPGLIVLGHYGAQRWQDGVLSAPPAPPGIEAAREALPKLLAEVSAPAGTTIEDKGTALAVHTRRTADPAAALALLREPLSRLADDTALTLEPGRLVLELRCAGSPPSGVPARSSSAGTTSVTSRPSPRSGHCGPKGSQAAPSPARARSHRRWRRPPTSSSTVHRESLRS